MKDPALACGARPLEVLKKTAAAAQEPAEAAAVRLSEGVDRAAAGGGQASPGGGFHPVEVVRGPSAGPACRSGEDCGRGFAGPGPIDRGASSDTAMVNKRNWRRPPAGSSRPKPKAKQARFSRPPGEGPPSPGNLLAAAGAWLRQANPGVAWLRGGGLAGSVWCDAWSGSSRLCSGGGV